MSSVPNKQDITITNFLQVIKQGWKLLAAGIILGGLIGFLVSNILPPRYEGVAVFSFSIDFARTGLLTDVEEDQAFEAAGDMVNSTQVFQMVQTKAVEDGFIPETADLRKVFTAERRFDQWLLKVTWTDPETAATLANLWGHEAETALQTIREAAWKADTLHRHILSLESCLQQSTSGLAVQPLCQAANRTELLAEVEKSGVELNHWQSEARGYFPGLNYSLAREASIPDSPILHSRGTLVLAGSLAGLFIASLLILFIMKI